MPDVAPIPNKLFVAQFPTPNGDDKYLYVRVQTDGVGYDFPKYGDQVPERYREEWPDYRCSLIAPNKQLSDGWVTIVYTKKREKQDDDNFSITYDTGSNTFPKIVREYIYDRQDYLTSGPLALGTADPGILANTDPMFPDAILVLPDQESSATDDPVLQSLYVKVTRTFMRVPDLTDSDDVTAAALFGTRAEYPYGKTAWPRITWRIPCDSETVATPLSSICPIAAYSAGTYAAGSLTGCATNGTTTVTCASTAGLGVGMNITGADIPASTTIASITSSTAFMLSQSATGTSSGLTLTTGQYLRLIAQSYDREKEVIVGLTRIYEPVFGPLIPQSDTDKYFQAVRTTHQIVAQTAIPATSELLIAELVAAGVGVIIEYRPNGEDGLRSTKIVSTPNVPDLTDSGDLTAAALFGYRVERPYGLTAWPRVTWRTPCDSMTVAAPLSNICPIVGYTGGTFGDTTSLTSCVTNGTTTVTCASTANLRPGALIAGTNITAGTTVASITNSTTFILSAVATGSGSGLTFTTGYYIKLIEQTYELDNGRVVAAVRTYEPTYGPVLVESDFEPRTNTCVRITKEIVAQSAIPATAALLSAEMAALGAGVTVEYKPMGMDGLRSIRIVSYSDAAAINWVAGNGNDRVYYGTRDHSFPDELLAAGWYWAWAQVGASFALDVALYAKIKEGYRGPCRCRFTDRYTTDPTAVAFLAALPTITSLRPEAVAIPTAFSYAGANVSARAQTFTIPATLHDTINLSNTGTVPSGTDIAGNSLNSITPTNVTTITSGNVFLVAIIPERWNFGYYLFRIIEVYAP